MDIERAARRIRLKDLLTLSEVVRAGGIRKAAPALHLSQPAVSRAVQELEDVLGVPLLQRGRHGVEPTTFAEALVRRTRNLADELQTALREIKHLADPTTGHVRLACMETLHAGLVGACVAELVIKHPLMRFVLESGQASDLISYFLQQRQVDLVVARPLALPLPPEIEGEPLFHDQLHVVVGHQHPMARRRKLSLRDLAGEHWILSRNETMPESPVAQAHAAQGLPMPERLVASGSLHTRYLLLERGHFVTVVPHSLLPFSDHRRRVRILPIALPRWSTPTMVLTVKGRDHGPAAELFLSALRTKARALA